MTNEQSARIIDIAHRAYRSAIGTYREEAAYAELCCAVEHVQRAQEEAEWERLIAVHRSAA